MFPGLARPGFPVLENWTIGFPPGMIYSGGEAEVFGDHSSSLKSKRGMVFLNPQGELGTELKVSL